MGKRRRQEERAARKRAKAQRPASQLDPSKMSVEEQMDKGLIDPPSDFNVKQGGIDPHVDRKPPPPSPHSGYHWHNDVLVNGMHQPVGRMVNRKLVPIK